jgi:hypothetical protein
MYLMEEGRLLSPLVVYALIHSAYEDGFYHHNELVHLVVTCVENIVGVLLCLCMRQLSRGTHAGNQLTADIMPKHVVCGGVLFGLFHKISWQHWRRAFYFFHSLLELFGSGFCGAVFATHGWKQLPGCKEDRFIRTHSKNLSNAC